MRNEEGHLVAESKHDFSGWEIISVQDFKPGVKKVTVRHIPPNVSKETPAECMVVYTPDEYVPTEFRAVAV